MRFFKVANVVAVHFASGIALSALSAASGASGLGFPKPGDEAAKTIRADFKAPPPGYGEVPFWWWSGRDPLDKERLLEQIKEMHRAGIPALCSSSICSSRRSLSSGSRPLHHQNGTSP